MERKKPNEPGGKISFDSKKTKKKLKSWYKDKVDVRRRHCMF